MRSCILAWIRFLTWIDATEGRLETLTQHDVDLWLTTQHAEHAYVEGIPPLGPFLRPDR
jgi:hypothetical protein